MGTTETNRLNDAERILSFLASVILPEFNEADVDDAKQNVRLKLIETIIPTFDPARGVPFDKYATLTIRRALISERRKLSTSAPARDFEDIDASVTDADAEAERLRTAILHDPEAVLGKSMADLLHALMTSPDRRAAAAKLGIKTESIYQGATRLRHRIRELFQLDQSRFSPPLRTA